MDIASGLNDSAPNPSHFQGGTLLSERMIDTVLPRLTARIHQVMAGQGVPGVALGLIEDQQVLWSGGFADVSSQRAMGADAICGVASITKTFTATAIKQLRSTKDGFRSMIRWVATSRKSERSVVGSERSRILRCGG